MTEYKKQIISVSQKYDIEREDYQRQEVEHKGVRPLIIFQIVSIIPIALIQDNYKSDNNQQPRHQVMILRSI